MTTTNPTRLRGHKRVRETFEEELLGHCVAVRATLGNYPILFHDWMMHRRTRLRPGDRVRVTVEKLPARKGRAK